MPYKVRSHPVMGERTATRRRSPIRRHRSFTISAKASGASLNVGRCDLNCQTHIARAPTAPKDHMIDNPVGSQGTLLLTCGHA